MQHYRLIFDGHFQARQSREDVVRRLADLFQVDPHQINTLFSNPPVVLKEDLSYQEALKDKAAFEATGALCRLEPRSSISASARRIFGRHATERPKAERAAADDSERRYGLFHPYGLSFFSRSFYADVAAHWRGLAFVHLFLALLLSAGAYTLHFRSLIDAFVAEQAPAIIAQVPEVVISDGTVHVTVTEPYAIREPDSDRLFAVIDTTGKITSLEQTEALLLLTASRLAVRLSPEDIRIIDLRPIASLQIDRTSVSQWVQDIQKWAPFILFPLALGFSFIFRSLQAVLYGGLGMALAALHKTPLTFGAAVSVAIMAMTPVLLLDALLTLTEIYLPLWGFVSFLLAVGYLVFGIRSAVRPE
jgi:hypothetical protein